jgi:hypothetical protein
MVTISLVQLEYSSPRSTGYVAKCSSVLTGRVNFLKVLAHVNFLRDCKLSFLVGY